MIIKKDSFTLLLGVFMLFILTMLGVSCKQNRDKVDQIEIINLKLHYTVREHIPFLPAITSRGDPIRHSRNALVISDFEEELLDSINLEFKNLQEYELVNNKFFATILCEFWLEDGVKKELLIDTERAIIFHDSNYYKNDRLVILLQRIALTKLLGELPPKW